MSKTIILGTLNTIKLLFFLSPNTFFSSRVIRNKFPDIKYDTMYKKLNTLRKQGFVEVKEKAAEYAGDDRTEYKLSSSGELLRKELINKMLKLLGPHIKKIVKGKVEALRQPILEDKDKQFETFLMEFSGEAEGLVDQTVLEQLQKILSKLLE